MYTRSRSSRGNNDDDSVVEVNSTPESLHRPAHAITVSSGTSDEHATIIPYPQPLPRRTQQDDTVSVASSKSSCSQGVLAMFRNTRQVRPRHRYTPPDTVVHDDGTSQQHNVSPYLDEVVRRAGVQPATGSTAQPPIAHTSESPPASQVISRKPRRGRPRDHR